MIPNELKQNESGNSEKDSTTADREKNLILLETKAKRNVDQTISAPDHYASRYHYNTRNIDKYIELCPHCKKPTSSAFDRTVVDSAIDYLNGKRMFMSYKKSRDNFLPNIALVLVFGTAVYFLVSHI